VKAVERKLDKSAELLERARRVIPAFTQTLSKNPTQWVQGVAPAYVSHAKGAHVWDVDGNRYVDFPMALGPVILGHADPGVSEAIERQLRDGIVFTLPHPVEVEVAERIVELVPGAERVRFGKTGSDVTTAAIRLARACTGRDRVLVCGYHGWHDWYIGSTSCAIGVPAAVRELTGTFAFNDLASLEAALDGRPGETAAVILEPCGVEEPDPGFLEGVVSRAHADGAVVVFDEIITGFRLALGGAQERYGVRADLAVFGKALGNGMPISALTGKAELMDRLEEVFFSGTHGGETLSLAAARAVLDQLDARAYEYLYEMGERLRAGIRGAVDDAGVGEFVQISGAAPRTIVAIREPDLEGLAPGLPAKTLVQQELVKRGVLFNGSNFICLAHSDEDIELAIAAYADAFFRLAEGLAGDLLGMLEGEPIQPAFRPLA
jgi:glutamate-1-semialdehyde aminotransferase